MSTKALTLYEVEDTLQCYLDTEADVPEEMQAEFQAALSAAGAAALDKRDAVIRAFQTVESHIEAVKAEKKRLSDRQQVLENGLKRFRRYLAGVLQQLPAPAKGARKLEGRIGTISLRKGSESVEVLDASKLPNTCAKVTVTLPAVTWHMLIDWLSRDGASISAAVGTAIVSAPVEIEPDKAALKAYIEAEIKAAEAESFDLAVAESEDEKRQIRESIAAAIAKQHGARFVIGEPPVVVK